MTGSSLRTYERLDVTADTDLRVLGERTIAPAGCLIHTSDGVDSLHWLQGGSADAGKPASCNALIGRDGTQWRICPDSKYPYHAGQSLYFDGQLYSGNEVSQRLIGIELECLNDERPTFEQYDSLADLQIMYAWHYQWRWPITTLGHYAVARPPGRRSDPVNFDWGSWLGRLYYRSAQMRLPGL